VSVNSSVRSKPKPAVPPNGEKKSSSARAGAKLVGYLRLPHNFVAAECGLVTERLRNEQCATMKTKQILMLTLLLLGVSLRREAQAFYNPNTGRWLNRDPVGERGGVNLLAFVNNAVTGHVDELGRGPVATTGAPAGNMVEVPLPTESPTLNTPPAKKSPPKPGKPEHPGGGQCPNNSAPSNGCGSQDWKGKLVPNMPLRFVNFKPACNVHDVCYGTCGKGKADCDKDFLGDLLGACMEKYGWNSIQPIPPDLAAKQLLCSSLAQTYYNAVAAAGDAAYADGQKQGCKCKCEKK